MNRLIEISHRLRCWFSERNIDTEGLTVILNFTDAGDRAAFDLHLNREIQDLSVNLVPLPFAVETKDFQINGIRFKVEGP